MQKLADNEYVLCSLNFEKTTYCPYEYVFKWTFLYEWVNISIIKHNTTIHFRVITNNFGWNLPRSGEKFSATLNF